MSAAADPAPQYMSGVKLWLSAVALSAVNFVVVLDLTIANVSVPHIAGGLAISPTQGTWAITSYAVAEAISVPLTGWLSARFGAVRWLLVSLIGFGLFSFLCGISTTITMLVVCRILQGLSGGPMMPLTQALIPRIFPPEKLPIAFGIWSMTTIVAPITGPILGGWISDNWSWPWIFFINLPVVLFCILVVARTMPEFELPRSRQPIDKIGLILLVIWVGAFQIMMDTGREHDWFADKGIVALAIIASVGFLAFIIWEWYDDHPIVNIRLFKDRAFTSCLIVMTLVFAGYFMGIVMVPLWLQQTMGYSAAESGHAVAYSGYFAMLMAPLASVVSKHIDTRKTIAAGVAVIGISFFMRLSWSTDVSYSVIAISHAVQGLGMPFYFVGIVMVSMMNIAPRDAPAAAGILAFARSICAAVGTAVSTTMWDHSTREARSQLVGSLHVPADSLSTMAPPGMSVEQTRGVLDMLVQGQASTIGAVHVFAIAGICMMLASFLMITIVPKPKGPLQAGAAH